MKLGLTVDIDISNSVCVKIFLKENIMLPSRALGVIKAAKLLNRPSIIKETVRNGHAYVLTINIDYVILISFGSFCSYNYRTGYDNPQTTAVYLAEGIQGFAWWWILWHLWTEPGHILVSTFDLIQCTKTEKPNRFSELELQ